MSEKLLTTREVGELAQLSAKSVLRRWRAGEFAGYRLSSNVLRFRETDIDAWLEGPRVGPPTTMPALRAVEEGERR